MVTGYNDIRTIYSEPAFGRSGMTQDSAPRLTAGLLLQGGIGSLDDASHTKIRRAINRELSARRMATLRSAAESIMAGLLDELAAAGGGDYIHGVSRPFALNVLCELLGVPPEDRAVTPSQISPIT